MLFGCSRLPLGLALARGGGGLLELTGGTGKPVGAVTGEDPSCRFPCRWCAERLGGGGDHHQQDASPSGMRVPGHCYFEPPVLLAGDYRR